MSLSPEEQAAIERRRAGYLRGQSDTMRGIERQVCGCDYGATGWATRAEVDRVTSMLGLAAGMRLMDLGAGAGWPGLYLGQRSNCETVLVDLPFEALTIAARRAEREGLSGRVCCVVADAAEMPFASDSFDAISHVDLLCCLRQKREVLGQCRRLVRPRGRMVFSVLYVPPGLDPAQYRQALESGPEFIETDTDYPSLLSETGWTVIQRKDMSGYLRHTCQRQRDADVASATALESLLGPDEVRDRLREWEQKLTAISAGLLRRELFHCIPQTADHHVASVSTSPARLSGV